MTAPAKHSRRDVLKKSAVAGAVFWAVPVIESVTARAAAASGGVFPCSWAIVVYYLPDGSGNPDNYTYYVNGWQGAGGSCSQGNNGKFNGTVGPFLVTKSGPVTTNSISITFNTQDVLIKDTVTNEFIDINLAGGNGKMAVGGGTAAACSQGVLTHSGRSFGLSGSYQFLAGVAFGGNVDHGNGPGVDLLTPGSGQSLTFNNCT